jgi:hypothetical protein
MDAIAHPSVQFELRLCCIHAWALSELAMSDSDRQAVGTMDSYLLVVPGVNIRRGRSKLIRRGCAVRTGAVGEGHNRTTTSDSGGNAILKPSDFFLPDSRLGPDAGIALPVEVVSL